MPTTEALPARAVRRMLLSLQALDGRRAASTPAAVARLVTKLGYVQIDSINVIDRAHHLILAARLDGFRPAHLSNALERRRSLFEHWTHDASVIPMNWYPHWRHRFARYAARDRTHAWWRERFGAKPELVVQRVLARVEREGALRARDFEREPPPTGSSRQEPGGWWNWRPEKAALEHLWRSGRLAIAGRERFEKIYDLPERVHADAHALSATEESAHRVWACRAALERLGVATEREVSAFLNAVPVNEVRAWSKEAVSRGELLRVMVKPERGGKPVACVALPHYREKVERSVSAPKRSAASRNAPRATAQDSALQITPLAPFDPVIRDRARTERLFGFNYRFEAFTPAAKRVHGYYTMPLLEGDALIGRIDPKFDRDEGVLLVRGPWWEPGIRLDRARRERLDRAMALLAHNIGAESWRLVDRLA